MSVKSGQIVAKMWAFISPCAFSTAVLHMQALKAWQSPKILAHKWGGGGGPPLGEFNPPPTEGVQCVLDHKPNRPQLNAEAIYKRPNSRGQALYARQGSYTPLFFSPQEGWDDRNPVTKFAPSAFSGLLNRFFCSSRVCFKNDFEKTSKKLRKS